MSMHRFAAAAALGAGVLLTACTPDSSDQASEDTAPEPPEISVTVPEERLTPFCEAMIDLSDRLRSGDVDDANALIIDTYRSIQPDVPLEIAADFDIVLTAMEAGRPPPTDPPIETPVPSTAVTGASPGVTQPGAVDEGFDPDTSPSERINSYVAFACRSTGNNPGPPATQPGDVPPDDEDDEDDG